MSNRSIRLKHAPGHGRITAVSLAIGALFAGIASSPAWAACTPGAPCVADGVTENLPSGTTYSRTSSSNYALRARNGGVITGTDLILNSTNSSDNPVVRADSGGSITLDNATITNNGKDGGVYATGAGSTITLNGGSIGNVKKEAVIFGSGGTVILNGVDISTEREAITDDKKSNTTLVLNGGSITSGREGITMEASSSTVTIDGTTFTTGRTAIESKGTLTAKNFDITLTSTSSDYRGLYLQGGDSTLTSGTVQLNRGAGIYTSSNMTGMLQANTISITSTGNNGYGVRIRSKTGADLTGMTITTAGLGAHGIYSDGELLTLKNSTVTVNGVDSHAFAMSGGLDADLENVILTAKGAGGHGVYLDKPLLITLKGDNTITVEGDSGHGLYANGAILVTVAPGTMITVSGNDSSAINLVNSRNINISGATLNVNGSNGEGVYTYKSRDSVLADTTIDVNGLGSWGVIADQQSELFKLDNITLNTASGTAGGVTMADGSALEVRNSKITTDAGIGLKIANQSDANLWNTQLAVSGQHGVGVSMGVSNAALLADPVRVTLSNQGSVVAADGIAVRVQGGAKHQFSVSDGDSVVSGDRLVFVDNAVIGGNTHAGVLNFLADGATLSGGSLVADLSTLNMTLDHGADWVIRHATNPTTYASISAQAANRSDVSVLNLTDGTVRFAAPVGGSYQALYVGSGAPGTAAVYNAGGNARLVFNTLLNGGGALGNQHTDRVLIDGDVSGSTVVHVAQVPGSPGGATSPDGIHRNAQGISLIQVSGAASESSFALEGGYVTMNEQPWQYTLHAYGPGAASGAADDDQRLVAGSSDWWDYRLQNAYLEAPPAGDEDGGNGGGNGNNGGGGSTPALQIVPQAANYLLAPSVLLQTAQMDMTALHQHLGEIRAAGLAGGRSSLVAFSSPQPAAARFYDPYGVYRDWQVHNAALRVGGNAVSDRDAARREVFLRGYGGRHNYKSNLSAQEYGFDARVRHHGVQAGGSLYVLEGASGTTRFGLAASAGSADFTPRNVAGTLKTRVDRWTAAPYVSWQHDSGAYVDGVVAYGGFSGKVNTQLRGQTAKLKGDSLAASIAAGMPLALNDQGLALVPQVQLGWQHLHFKRTRDVDNFPVALGAHNQFTGSLGAQLQQTMANHSTVYGRLAVEHAWRDSKQVWLGQDFHLGKSGSHLHGSVGVNAYATPQLQVYGEASWQTRLSSAGLRGVGVSAGVRYRF